MNVLELARLVVVLAALALMVLQVALQFAGKSGLGQDLVLLGAAWLLAKLAQA